MSFLFRLFFPPDGLSTATSAWPSKSPNSIRTSCALSIFSKSLTRKGKESNLHRLAIGQLDPAEESNLSVQPHARSCIGCEIFKSPAAATAIAALRAAASQKYNYQTENSDGLRVLFHLSRLLFRYDMKFFVTKFTAVHILELESMFGLSHWIETCMQPIPVLEGPHVYTKAIGLAINLSFH